MNILQEIVKQAEYYNFYIIQKYNLMCAYLLHTLLIEEVISTNVSFD